MRLIDWNSARTAGQGRSGTRYAIYRGSLGDLTSGLSWLVAVDDEPVCATDSVRSAVRRVEYLEALRCFLSGLGHQITNQQLQQAQMVAGEMREAIEQSLAEGKVDPAEVQVLHDNIAELTSLSRLIGRELAARRRHTAAAGTVLH